MANDPLGLGPMKRTHPVFRTVDGEALKYRIERRDGDGITLFYNSLWFRVDVDRNGIIIVSDRLGVVVARYREWSAVEFVNGIGAEVSVIKIEEIEV